MYLVSKRGLLRSPLKIPILTTQTALSLFAFPTRMILKLDKTVIVPRIAKKVITDLDFSNVSSSYCISLVVLNNCVLDLSYLLATF